MDIFKTETAAVAPPTNLTVTRPSVYVATLLENVDKSSATYSQREQIRAFEILSAQLDAIIRLLQAGGNQQ